MSLTIAGLGFGEKYAVTLETMNEIKKAEHIIIRTKEHPSVEILDDMGIEYESCDHLYDEADSFSELYYMIAKLVMDKSEKEDVLYLVPGSPSVAESTVKNILKEKSDVKIIEAVSFIEPCLTAVQVDPVDGFLLLDAVDVRNANLNSNLNIMITQVWNEFLLSEVKLNLMNIFPENKEVISIENAGIKEEQVKKVKLYELDRVIKPGIRLSLFIKKENKNNVLDMLELIALKGLKEEQLPVDEDLKKDVRDLIDVYESIKNNVEYGSYELLDLIEALKDLIR